MGFGLVPSFRNERRAIGGIIKSIDNIWSHLNVEIKHHDKTSSGTQVVGGTWTDITAIPAGITGGSNGAIDQGYRDGDKIRIRSIHVKGRVQKVDSNVLQDTSHIMLIKYYDNFLGDALDINKVYDEYSNVALYNRLRRPEFKGQYKILAHKVIRLSGVEDKDNERSFNIYLKPKKRKGTFVEWEGTSANDPHNGKYYLFDYSENGTNQVNWSSRVTYVDN